MMTDDKIIEEAIRLVSEGVCVTLPVNGKSMLPFIIGGQESVILQQPNGIKVGDVVLAWVKGGYYVVHRIIAIKDGQPTDGSSTERLVTLMGDGNPVGTEQCTENNIKARVTHVVNANGQRHEIDNLWRCYAAKLWWHLRPIRRYLLAIYRRL